MTENKEKKEAEKAEQMARDIKAMKEFNRLLDLQEQLRVKEKEARMERQKNLMDRVFVLL